MASLCPPAELVSHILTTLAFSGQTGLLLLELWREVAAKLDLDSIDDFQKQIIWLWLFFKDAGADDLVIHHNNIQQAVTPKYPDMFNETGVSEESLQVYPSSDTQWKHLTMTDNYSQIKTQLGDLPFQLLCLIAKFGPSGVITPTLCKLSGQDPRSIGGRLKKLEEMGFINKSSFYESSLKVHTTKSVHVKFSADSFESSSNSVDDGKHDALPFNSSIKSVRNQIMNAVKSAPDQIRGFRDLKFELNLNNDRTSRIFYNSLCQGLEKSGYIKKILVNIPELDENKFIYCIKFLKPLPKDDEDLVDDTSLMDFTEFTDEDDPDQNTDDLIPRYNRIFPLTNQTFQFIASKGSLGTTIMDFARELTGIHYYRPFNRFLESFCSFTSDGKRLKLIKNYNDPNQNLTVVRIYDSEGKYKFIRLFAREFVDAQDAKPANEKPIKDTIQKLNLPKLNHKFLTKIKPITGPLLEKKVMEKKAPEKKRQTSSTTPETTKRQKRGRGRPTAAELKQKAEEEEREKQEEMKRQEEISHQQQLKQEQQQQQQHDEPIEESNPIEETINHIKAADMPAPRIVKKGPSKKNRVTNPTPIPTSDKSISIKSLKRRECIVDLIKKNGGVQYTSSNFVRDIDDALGNKQTTDNKTIARDISELIKNETLEVEPFVITRGTLTFHKKLLILKGLNPSPETLEKVKTKCINEKTHGSQAALPKTVNKTLHLFSKDSLASSNIGKNRLKSLNSKDNHQLEKASKRKSRKTKVKEDPDGENNKESSGKRKRKIKRTAANAEGDENDISSTSQNDPLLSVVSKGRRKPGTKKKKKSMFVSAPKMRKFRSTLKFDKSDATILFRAVIIRKSLRKTALDFEEIGSFIGINNAKEAKRKWNSTRRIIGGQAALERGTQSFEQIVMKGIANGLISEKDLIDCDLQFFLDLWRDFDSSELEIVDKTPLFTTIEQNRENYDIVKSYENDTDLYDTLEDNSMRQKELILSAYVASYKENESIKPDEYEELRTLIKSIVATSEENFSGDQLKKLLENHSQEDIEKVMTQLINDKVVVYFSLEDSNTRFMLSERFRAALSTKICHPKFFNLAELLRETLSNFAKSSKGLILSHGIQHGEMACLLQMVSNSLVSVVRINKPYKIDTYESRLIDREVLNCDIVVTRNNDHLEPMFNNKPVPLGKACSRIWLDMNGEINSQLWIKLISTLIQLIVFRPGITDEILHSKLKVILNKPDFDSVTGWLVETSCIIKKNHAYWVNDEWFSMLGP
ncbi:hypothetical protein HYPBUDRAFT_238357 [Hyphopichia burtonii NRRL Y-1933]|uniref:Uncharacterized protein n=1 Tax=Hyphopichia burtonii NRRL Y-1933 TaxID=984485 RepID=A0A1E4RMW4_9ASCO|nr:hypothetical protein HYPBUDRAFT_238357 [Hyphopichia burtonii NRRL Y-1933]ODV68614.1 hypothetical protein HYPBUDRAFT_238357 [Hyphopichia burtonii NRRL Y-1933]